MFFNSKRQRYTLTILAMSALTACGGGGGGSNPLPDAITSPVTTTANVTTATASAGLSFIASGRAESQPNALSSMGWTATALTGGAPDIQIANADCSNSTRNNRSINGISQSTWTCDAVVTIPAGLSLDANYRLSFQATDAKGNASNANVNVAATKAPPKPDTPTSPSSPPVVTASSTVDVAGGALVNVNCFATGGSPGPGNTYQYNWVVKDNPSGLAIGLTTNGSVGEFRAPVVSSPAYVILQCRGTDVAGLTSTADTRVNIAAGSSSTAVAEAGPTQSVGPGALVNLNGSASKAPNNGQLYYLWTQTEGPLVSLSNNNTATPSFLAPAVSTPTRLTFKLNATTVQISSPTQAAAAETDFVSIYVLPYTPLTLTVTASSVVSSNTAVAMSVQATPSDGTLYYSWTQVSGPSVTLGGATTSRASFNSPALSGSSADLLFQVSVSRKPIATAAPEEIVRADVTIRVVP